MIKDIIKKLEETLVQRGKDYDKEDFERSIPKVVGLFNLLTGLKLTPKQGWLFMIALKLVRMQQNPDKSDTYTDLGGYAVLLEEQHKLDNKPEMSDACANALTRALPPKGMKPFNLDNALEGDLVRTREGRTVLRLELINATDRLRVYFNHKHSPVIYTKNGYLCDVDEDPEFIDKHPDIENQDLFMVVSPVPQEPVKPTTRRV